MSSAQKQINNKRIKQKILNYIEETLIRQLLIIITI